MTVEAELKTKVARARARRKVPGVAVGVLVDGEEHFITSGVTSVDNPLPVTDATLFNIGSTGKTFTATTLMLLVQQRKLSLDDPVVSHLPDFRVKDEDVTRKVKLHHLVTHTVGWDGDAGIEVDWGWGDDALARRIAALRDVEQHAPPGMVWAYNNSGFQIAGRIIEVVTGKPFEAAVRQLVFEPLGLEMSFYFPWEAATRRFAVGHISTAEGPRVAHSWATHRAVGPAGGIMSSVRDQIAWARLHLGDGKTRSGSPFLDPSTLELMQRQHFEAGSFVDGVGLCWLIRDIGGTRAIGHGGNANNIQLSSFTMVPSRGFAITVLTNAGAGGGLHDEIEKWALEKYLGIRERERNIMRLPASTLTEYAGTYRTRITDYHAAVSDGKVVLQPEYNMKAVEALDVTDDIRAMLQEQLKEAPKPETLRFFAPDRAISRDKSRYEFLRDAEGRVAWMRTGGRLAPKAG